jgi:dihydroorotase
VHFRQPGAEHKETILTGSQAAIHGGVTTTGDMPNNIPVTDTVAQIQKKIAIAENAPGKIFFHIAAHNANYPEIEKAHGLGLIKAIKLFLGETTGMTGRQAAGGIGDYFALAHDLDLVLMIHAEKNDLIRKNKSKYPALPKHHPDIRSMEAERVSTMEALEMAAKFSCRTYFCHVTNMSSFNEIVKGKKNGLPLCIEVTPHHLIFDRSVLENGTAQIANANFFLMNPPLREKGHVEFLRSKLALDPKGKDQIDVIGSDHAPHLWDEKERIYPESPSGVPGVEFFLPLMAEFYHQGLLDLPRLENLLSGHAAHFFNLEDRGSILPEKRADLVIWDGKKAKTISNSMVKSKCGWTPYSGLNFHGWPNEVYVAGQREL